MTAPTLTGTDLVLLRLNVTDALRRLGRDRDPLCDFWTGYIAALNDAQHYGRPVQLGELAAERYDQARALIAEAAAVRS